MGASPKLFDINQKFEESKEMKESKEVKEIKEIKKIKEIKEIKEMKEVKEIKEIKEVKEEKEMKEMEQLKDVKELKEVKGSKKTMISFKDRMKIYSEISSGIGVSAQQRLQKIKLERRASDNNVGRVSLNQKEREKASKLFEKYVSI